MSDEELFYLEKAMARLKEHVQPEEVRGALETVLRSARSAHALLRHHREEEEWARRLAEMGSCLYALRTRDGLECLVREESGTPTVAVNNPIIRRQCSDRRDPRPRAITEEFSKCAPREIRTYEFTQWKSGPNGRRIACYQEVARP